MECEEWSVRSVRSVRSEECEEWSVRSMRSVRRGL